MSRLEALKTLESTLENFLTRVIEIQDPKINRLSSIDMLNEIARDSLRGRFINNRLGDWFADNRIILEKSEFAPDELTRVGNMLESIKKGLDESEPASKKLADEIDSWKAKGVIPKRKLILKLKPETPGADLFSKFKAVLSREFGHLDSGEFDGRHMLTVLDDVLKCADAKEDDFYLHLAASMIYYLKMKGYKVSPFVKRLRRIESAKIKTGEDDV